MYNLPFLDSLIFGSIISATDPVSVLAVFQVILAHSDCRSPWFWKMLFAKELFVDIILLLNYMALVFVKFLTEYESSENVSFHFPWSIQKPQIYIHIIYLTKIYDSNMDLVHHQELGTDVNLYALVFGESVLNDAVSTNTITRGCQWIFCLEAELFAYEITFLLS